MSQESTERRIAAKAPGGRFSELMSGTIGDEKGHG
jgi:hypothetical protein